MTPRAFFTLLKDTFNEWNEDKAPRLGAALAYYTIFSLAPLLIIVIAIAGLALGQQAVQGQIVGQTRGLVGDQGAQLIQTMIQASRKSNEGILATVIGVVTLLLGALGVFGQLQDSLNTIFEVEPKPGRGILAVIRDRFLSLSMVLGTGFLLLVSLVISAALAGLSGYINSLIPGMDLILTIADLLLSFVIIALLFALIFKYLPDIKIAWHDVWIGAIITTLLFLIGRFLIGFYLGRASVGSTYGAAGSLIVVLVWIYYSAQILFFGAEFTQVYANKYGSGLEPADNAIAVTEEKRAAQGIPHRKSKATPQTNRKKMPMPMPETIVQPVPIKTNLWRQRATVASIEAVPATERHTQTANPGRPLSGRPSIVTTIFGFIVGVIAGISLSRTATTEHASKR